jgi:O-antigen/teichoic acid export membrane protein
MLISVPLTLGYLGTERFGLWIAISSAIAILGIADLGLGNGLMNAVAEAHGNDDEISASRYISSAFAIMSGVSFLGMLWFALIYPRIPWHNVFNVSSPAAVAEAGPALAVAVACFLLRLPLSVVERVQSAYQEGFVNSLWFGLGNIVGLLAVLFVIMREGGLVWLALVMAGTPLLAAFVNALVLFGVRRPWLRPRPGFVSRAASLRVFRTGSVFFVLQIAMIVGFQTDNLVIAQILGADEVPQYAVPMTLFAIGPMLLSFVIAGLWPAYGEAIARGDITWVKRTFIGSVGLGLAINVPCSMFLLIFGKEIVRAWSGGAVVPSTALLVGLALWATINSFAGPFAMLFNGANVVTFQAISAVLMAMVNFALSILLVRQIGVAGAIIATVAAQCIFTIIPYSAYLPRLIRSWEDASGFEGVKEC